MKPTNDNRGHKVHVTVIRADKTVDREACAELETAATYDKAGTKQVMREVRARFPNRSIHVELDTVIKTFAAFVRPPRKR